MYVYMYVGVILGYYSNILAVPRGSHKGPMHNMCCSADVCIQEYGMQSSFLYYTYIYIQIFTRQSRVIIKDVSVRD